MASVPVSTKELEDIIVRCTRDLLNSWGVDQDLNESEIEKFQQDSIDIVTFIIESFMIHLTDVMEARARDAGIEF